MTDDLSPTRALAVWGLLARQGRAREGDVKPKADRDALVADGYVAADKRTKTVALTDRGWHWAGTHLDAVLPPAQRPLQDLLLRLGAHLAASGGTLAEFIGEAPPLPAPPVEEKRPAKAKAPPKPKAEPKPKAPSKEKAPPKPKPPTAPVLRRRIEDAYLLASGGARSEPVRLSKLRAALGDLDRKTVDAGLARILRAKTETASLSSIGDNKDIDPAEREAAYSPAGDPFHLIRIK